MKTYFFLYLILISGLVSCSKKADTSTTASSDTLEVAKTTEQIKISAEQFKNLHLELVVFSEIPMNDEVKTTGMVDVPPENIASISVPIAGFVKTISSGSSHPGQYVAKGTVMATVESIEFIQMQQDYFQAVAQAAFLQKELERQQTLNSEDIGVKKKLQQAEAEFNSNLALTKSLEAKLKLSGINMAVLKKGDISTAIGIVAPISGYVKNTNINTGKSVSPGDVLFELISKDDLHIELKVLEKDVFKVQKGQKVLIDDKRLGDHVMGTVFLVGQAFEDETKAVSVHVHPDNEQQERKMIPGMFLNAKILTGTRLVGTLPESAVLRESDGDFILILEKQNEKEVVFRKIRVKLGGVQGRNIEIQPLTEFDHTKSVVISNGHFLSGMNGTDEE